MSRNVRDELLAGDFAANLQLLQRYPQIDIQIILSKAHQLKESHKHLPNNELLHPTHTPGGAALKSGASGGSGGGSTLLDIDKPQLASEKKRIEEEQEKHAAAAAAARKLAAQKAV